MKKSKLTFAASLLVLSSFSLLPPMQAGQTPAPPPASSDTFLGYQALFHNTTGSADTAVGYRALFYNTTGSSNTAVGHSALFNNTTGFFNVATGGSALLTNTTGNNNVATGLLALSANTIGTRNTATGTEALYSNTTGSRNTATGFSALQVNQTGEHNSAYGWASLLNSQGNLNIGVGDGAGETLTTGDNNIDIGNIGVAGESNTIRIGTQVFTPEPFPSAGPGLDHPAHTATYIAGIYPTPVVGTFVAIDPNGHLGVLASSKRFKTDIKAMDQVSETLLSLKPVTFHYKHDIDPKGTAQFGLVAEEVEKVNPDLVARDANGKVYTVRYDAVNAMLLNEFLKEHRKVLELEAKVAQQQKDFTARLKEEDSKIEAVNQRLERVAPLQVADKR